MAGRFTTTSTKLKENTNLFVSKLRREYESDFGDITKNFCTALYQVKNGVKILLTSNFARIPASIFLKEKAKLGDVEAPETVVPISSLRKKIQV